MISLRILAITRTVPLACLAMLCIAGPGGQPPHSTLHIVRGDTVAEWWRSDRAPIRWTGPLRAVSDAFIWGTARPGVDTASAMIHVNRGLLRLRVVAVRLDPELLDLRLIGRTLPNGLTGDWSVDDAPEDAVFAVNAGQFSETGPWGWVILNGSETRYPGEGPLVLALGVDSSGAVHWIPASAIPVWRRNGGLTAAFQSYPILLDSGGTVPRLLRTSSDVDRDHRDARLAAGRLADGRILFLLTRFAGAGRIMERFPAGLTTPETAALMGALGARPAVMLDGGLSAQMMVRGGSGQPLAWPGSRHVPLALVAFPRH